MRHPFLPVLPLLYATACTSGDGTATSSTATPATSTTTPATATTPDTTAPSSTTTPASTPSATTALTATVRVTPTGAPLRSGDPVTFDFVLQNASSTPIKAGTSPEACARVRSLKHDGAAVSPSTGAWTAAEPAVADADLAPGATVGASWKTTLDATLHQQVLESRDATGRTAWPIAGGGTWEITVAWACDDTNPAAPLTSADTTTTFSILP